MTIKQIEEQVRAVSVAMYKAQSKRLRATWGGQDRSVFNAKSLPYGSLD